MSLNWETRNVCETRDYAVVTTHAHEVVEVTGVLRCRLATHRSSRRTKARRSSGATPTAASASRTSSTARKKTLWLQNERYQDAVIIERVVRAARRGVKVHIVARPPHTLKAEKLIEGVGGLRIMARRRRQGAQAQGLAPARQDAACRRRVRHRRLGQPRPRQLRRAARARDRGRRQERRAAARERSRSTTGTTRRRSTSPTRA